MCDSIEGNDLSIKMCERLLNIGLNLRLTRRQFLLGVATTQVSNRQCILQGVSLRELVSLIAGMLLVSRLIKDLPSLLALKAQGLFMVPIVMSIAVLL